MTRQNFTAVLNTALAVAYLVGGALGNVPLPTFARTQKFFELKWPIMNQKFKKIGRGTAPAQIPMGRGPLPTPTFHGARPFPKS